MNKGNGGHPDNLALTFGVVELSPFPIPPPVLSIHSNSRYGDVMARGPNLNFMAGVPELVILNLLREREMYGYQIVQAIRTGSSGALSLAEGVVYPVLHELKAEGALKARRQTVEG